jgi:hypothetical protein
LNAVAVLTDGSVVAAGNAPNSGGMPVVRWKADHTPAWSFVAGAGGTYPTVVAAGATGFIVSGINDIAADLDPSTGVDIVLGSVSFVSRYRF